jgi:hypothetical protein
MNEQFTTVQRLRDLEQYLQMIPRARKTFPDQYERLPLTTDEWLLKHGKPMISRLPLAERLVHAKSQVCYQNAWTLKQRYRRLSLRYCEGQVWLERCPIPVMHGWCINEHGAILDPSVSNNELAVYWGVIWDDEFAREKWSYLRRKKHIGILPNAYMFIRDDRDALDKGVAK